MNRAVFLIATEQSSKTGPSARHFTSALQKNYDGGYTCGSYRYISRYICTSLTIFTKNLNPDFEMLHY